ncbi:MAG: SAM-dependent methyltransferase [Candidatus Omnitrophica bacterium]|nr:SAM-dependent methyltransferase [Candidatus Omnitrophota bacterium]
MNARANRFANTSFRDPSGFMFESGGKIYRHITFNYRSQYDQLMNSGLYRLLVHQKQLISHREIDLTCEYGETAYTIIEPETIPFVSYPYEWCFSQLKDASLLTLQVLKIALEHGMILKDGSAYNVQFYQGKPIFIDTLSFDHYSEGMAWPGFKQFCQHFLGPLALMKYRDIRLNQLLQIFLDGIPLELASRLLPWRSLLNVPILLNLHLHARFALHYAGRTNVPRKYAVSKKSLLGLIGMLESAIQGISLRRRTSEWSRYYSSNVYSPEATQSKIEIVQDFLNRCRPSTVWDVGANEGVYSRLASRMGAFVLSLDSDPLAVEFNYLHCRKENLSTILPLRMDLCNPSPGIGWNNQERNAFWDRGHADGILALALLHHLAISNNLPLPLIAQMFAERCRYLILEFVPKSDPMVQLLLKHREDIFQEYTLQDFERTFLKYFCIESKQPVKNLERVIYFMQVK